ncbi:hypothetical protein I79_014095 [Cricetulus griseus]|uniref:Uncharacterized protein n=1 Tax=Cricetulus griseus TaxID=10029 RepID=G3HT74_CRIGR|nr:hypothetical protein I79_014095 [Cricetulus griseus]
MEEAALTAVPDARTSRGTSPEAVAVCASCLRGGVSGHLGRVPEGAASPAGLRLP